MIRNFWTPIYICPVLSCSTPYYFYPYMYIGTDLCHKLSETSLGIARLHVCHPLLATVVGFLLGPVDKLLKYNHGIKQLLPHI